MDFNEIVIRGYFDENNRKYLDKYFFRKFKKAEKEQFFEAEEFFRGCLKVTEDWEQVLQTYIHRRKRELYSMLSAAKNKTLSYGEMEGKTIEQKNQETIEYCKQELKDVRPDGIGSMTFNVNLSSLPNGLYGYNMSYFEILTIKESIYKAFVKALPDNEPQPKECGLDGNLKPDENNKKPYKVGAYVLKIWLYAEYEEGKAITHANKHEFSEGCNGYAGKTLYNEFQKIQRERKNLTGISENKKSDNAKKELFEQVKEMLLYENGRASKEFSKIYEKFNTNYSNKYLIG